MLVQDFIQNTGDLRRALRIGIRGVGYGMQDGVGDLGQIIHPRAMSDLPQERVR
jgi:hypothetical protein